MNLTTEQYTKRYNIVISDYGYDLYYYGQYEGTSTKIWLIRKWARDCWKENHRSIIPVNL